MDKAAPMCVVGSPWKPQWNITWLLRFPPPSLHLSLTFSVLLQHLHQFSCRDPADSVMDSGAAAGKSNDKDNGEQDGGDATSSTPLCRWLPPMYREEMYNTMKLIGPLVSPGRHWWGICWGVICLLSYIIQLLLLLLQAIHRLLDFSIIFVISVFCGHIGKAELAGYALALAVLISFLPFLLYLPLNCCNCVILVLIPKPQCVVCTSRSHHNLGLDEVDYCRGAAVSLWTALDTVAP